MACTKMPTRHRKIKKLIVCHLYNKGHSTPQIEKMGFSSCSASDRYLREAGIKARGSRNKIDHPVLTHVCSLYNFSYSTSQISNITGLAMSYVRNTLVRNGVYFRSVSSALAIASSENRLGKGDRSNVVMTDEWRNNLKRASLKRYKIGFRISSKGYLTYTTGGNKDKHFHRVKVENFIGRNLKKSEVVHHKDENKLNNNLSNLLLMTRSSHQSLHMNLKNKNRG